MKSEEKFIDSKSIEDKALNCLKSFIEDSRRISQYLTDNDKEPCWDGHLYLYNGKGKSKDCFEGRVPIQVKGIEVERFKVKKWKYKLLKADLKAYLNEPTFFIVCQIKKGNKERKLFYRELLPVPVKKLLRDMGPNDSRMTLFHPLTDKVEEFENQLLLFFRHSKKMVGFAGSAPLTMADAVKKGIKQFTFIVPEKFSDKIQLMRYLSTHDTYLYARLSQEYDVDFPISDGPIRFSFRTEGPCYIKVGDRVFYNSCSDEIKDGRRVVSVDNGLALNLPIDENDKVESSVKMKVNAKYLKDRILEGEFALALNDEKVLRIGDEVIPLVGNDNNTIDQLKKDLCRWKEIQKLLDKLHVSKSLDMTSITEEQFRLLDVLVDAILKKKTVTIPDQKSTLLLCEISNIKLLLWCSANEKGECTIGDYFDGTVTVSYLYNESERIRVSPFSYLQNEDLWQNIDNVDYSSLIPAAAEVVKGNEHCLEMLNYDVLSMISATDSLEDSDSDKRSKILEESSNLNNWLINNDSNTDNTLSYRGNSMQIITRQRPFTEDERSEMKSILESESASDVSKALFSILLENQEAFEKYYSQLSDNEKQILQNNPIWRFGKKLIAGSEKA